MTPRKKIDRWLFTLFAMPLFMATLSTAAANIFGVIFLAVYASSGYWRNWRTILLRPWFWPLMALIAINFLGMLWTQDTMRGLELLVKLKWVIYTLAGATLPWNRTFFILLVRMFLAGITVNAVIGGLQWLHIIPGIHMNPLEGPIGLTDRIFLSMTLTNAILWIAYDIKNKVVLPRALNIVLILIYFAQLITAGGRAGQLSFVILLPVALWLLYPGRWRIWAIAVGVLGIVGLVLSPHVQNRIQEVKNDFQQYEIGNVETSMGYRRIFWEGALLMVKEHPIIGVGTGDYKIEIARLQQMHAIPNTPSIPYVDHPHNSYLAYLADLGLSGLFIFLWFLWAVLREAWRHRESAASWFKLTYFSIFLLGSFTDTLIWGFHNAFALGLIVAIPSVLMSDSVTTKESADSGL